MSYDYDLFVIGAGSGGVRASRIAARHGARVLCFEERYLGGTCVNVGCVPKKLMVYASHYADEFADAAGFGWSVEHRQFSWRAFIEKKNAEILRLNG
ncbi:MAG TPA: FAD-dependent oxidoreductase, partial [Reyranella sp.]|nr:FAD-dependent oxidoreductase [Reyranella sp.]